MFDRPRPSQLRPALMPGDGGSRPCILSERPLDRGPSDRACPRAARSRPHIIRPANCCILLPTRIAINREVMGLHYRSDSEAGEELAEKLDALTQKVAYNTSGANAKRKRAAKVVNPAIIRDILDKAETEWA